MDIDKPLISVITVCYNAVNEIEDTIRSVVDCAYPNIEYIIIDGGSIDGTVDIIERYKEHIYYWISESDGGIYDAINKALMKATGDWILHVNVGDQLLSIPIAVCEPDSIEYSAICGSIMSEGNVITKAYCDWRIKLRNTIPHQGLFYNFKKNKIEYDLTYKIVADYALNLDMYLRGDKIKIVEQVVCFHSLLGISRSKQSALESFEVIKRKCGYSFFLLSFLYRKMLALIYYSKKIKR